MHILIIFVVIVLILFIPIPLSFHFYVSKDRFYVKIYNINLLSNDGGLIKKFLNKKKPKEDKGKNIEKTIDDYKDDNDSSNKKVKFKEIPFKKLYHNLAYNKFKPTLKFDSNISYSLGDSSKTAIAFGLLYNINPILLNIFSIIFKVKRYKNDFKPIFKDKILFELTLNSIITFNLAKIIYICFIIIKSFNKNRRWIPLFGDYYGW